MLSKIRESTVYKKSVHIKHFLEDYHINSSKLKLDSKILVIESDDWGSIRVPSKSVYDLLLKSGDTVNSDPFLRNDSLESYEDVEMLFDVLSDIRDSNGRKLPITANFAMANADFDFIRVNKEYARQSFYDTYEEYYGSKKVLDLIKQGIKERIFVPQLHCMEHLNVARWMHDFNNGKQDVVKAIECKMYGIGSSFSSKNKFGYMDNLNYQDVSEIHFLSKSLELAVEKFKSVFGYSSESFIASCLVWDDLVEKRLNQLGIFHIQSGIKQILPTYYSNSKLSKIIYHKMFEHNLNNQIYTIRNCSCEPSIVGCDYSISRCLEQVESAFKCGIPAIISMHRLNFIGSINKENRENGLNTLKLLFKEILRKHPDIIFTTSDQIKEFL